MYHKFKLSLIILVIIFPCQIVRADNMMKIHDANGYTNDTLEIAIEVINDDPFISFQCDVILPVSFQYIVNSALLTERGTDHVLNATIVSNDRIRLFSYSLNNSKFLGNSGVVVVFQLVCGPEEGTYPLKIEDCIIGDSLSNNILTSFENGTIQLEPSAVPILDQYNDFIFQLYPNPVTDKLTLRLDLNFQANVSIDFFDISGYFINQQSLGYLGAGVHELDISHIIFAEFKKSQNIYLCRITFLYGNKYFITKSKKIVIQTL